MRAFTIRVELHGASGSTYDELHRSMGKANFSRTLTFAGDEKFELPTAEYNYSSEQESLDTVLQKVKRATEAIWTGKFAVLVTLTTTARAHYGLKKLS